jgi:hypothetical protein
MMSSLKTKFGGVLAAAALAIGLAGAAPAATLSWSALPALSIGNPIATDTKGTVTQNSPNDIKNVRLGPWSGTPDPVPGVSQPYTSVGRASWAEYSWAGAIYETLKFVWGTPDTFNYVEFYRAGKLIDTIKGFGNGKNIALPTLLVTEIGDEGGFDTVRFGSKGVAFEFSNIEVGPSPIPVPAAGLMLLTALGGMALLRRRAAA